MQSRWKRLTLGFLVALMVVSICLIDVGAQNRKKRRPRRVKKPVAAKPIITNPDIAPQTDDMGDVRIVSTADENPTGSEQSETSETKAVSKKKARSDPKDMQQTINALSNQVEKLTDKLTRMQENDRALLDMERLTRAEQRAESLRSQLIDNESKLADLQSRLEQIEFAIKPENIERATAAYGSTRPEEAREARRRQMEGERSRIQSQVKILETSRQRLETAIANADTEVDLLRRRLNTQLEQQDSAQSQPTERPVNNRRKPE